jgi:hypothetical protein
MHDIIPDIIQLTNQDLFEGVETTLDITNVNLVGNEFLKDMKKNLQMQISAALFNIKERPSLRIRLIKKDHSFGTNKILHEYQFALINAP